MPRRLLLLAPLAALLLPAAASANPPFKVDFTFRFDVEFPQQSIYKNLAPWYTYFPHDPYVHPPTAPFPTWPSTWPPTPGPAVPAPVPVPKAMMPQGNGQIAGVPLGMHPGMMPVSWRTPAAPASWTQPASYGVPYYWYSR